MKKKKVVCLVWQNFISVHFLGIPETFNFKLKLFSLVRKNDSSESSNTLKGPLFSTKLYRYILSRDQLKNQSKIEHDINLEFLYQLGTEMQPARWRFLLLLLNIYFTFFSFSCQIYNKFIIIMFQIDIQRPTNKKKRNIFDLNLDLTICAVVLYY